MTNKIEITIDVIVHATEDISKIFQSFDEILEVKEEDFTMIETTGYFENPIIRLKAKLVKKQAQNLIKKIISHTKTNKLNIGYKVGLEFFYAKNGRKFISKLKNSLGESFKDTLILTLTEFGRTLSQNGGNGTDHGYGSAILMAGGLIKTAQVHTDWPGLKQNNLFEGRDLNSTIDSRSIYCSAISTCFDLDFELVKRKVFWNEKLDDYSSKLFKV